MESKKQLFNLVEDICHLNNGQWDNKHGTYDPNKSAALLIEEALESIGDTDPRTHAREIVSISNIQYEGATVSPVEQFDSLLDGLYITIGELHKFGLTPHQMVDGLQIVHNANMQKSGTKDSNGKVTKPANFIPPEERLQAILNKRAVR